MYVIKRDGSKEEYLESKVRNVIIQAFNGCGYSFSEDDIKNNTKVCEELIKFYIKNKGIIKDYNSFNYYVNDNEELCIKENIIYPYFIKQDP